MKAAYKILTMCIVVSILLCSFSISSFAALEGSPYSGVYIPVCPKYSVSEMLPYGENTGVIYHHRSISTSHDWIFFDMGDSKIQQSDSSVFINGFSGYYIDHNGANSSYDRLAVYSLSPVIRVTVNYNGSSYTMSTQTITTQDDTFNNGVFVRYKYLNTSLLYKTSFNRTIICSTFQYYNGRSLDYLIQRGSWGVSSDYVQDYFIGVYPDSVKKAIDSIESGFEDTEAALENYYNGLQNTLSTMSENIARLHNDVGDIQDSLNSQNEQFSQINNNISQAASQNQSAVSSAAAANSQAASQVADDIINAGDGSTINSDMSEVRGIVSKLNEWNSELNSFADSMDESISGVAGALDNGTSLFEKIVTAAPAGLAALIGFALVWFIARKIIGR